MVDSARSPGPAGTVSAEEHEALVADHAVLEDRFTAVNEVLSAIGRSAGDADTVLTAIVTSACRLCRADAAHVYLNEGGVYRLIAWTGLSEESQRYLADHPTPIDRGTLIGRVGLDRTTQQIPDVLADPEYGRHDLQRVAGFRTTMGTAMVVDDEVVGAMAVWRNDVAPFDQREMDMVAGFAAQAAMAINNMKLVTELQNRRAELARKVDELEALRAVGEAVSSSLDVENVLATVARYAVELSGTDGGSIMEYDEGDHSFTVRAVHRTEPEVVDQLRAARIPLEGTLVGRAARERRPIAVTDLGAIELDPHTRILYEAGWRSLVVVPMAQEERIVGSLIVRRNREGDFPPDVVDLLEAFADQSVLALTNAHLYRELQRQSDALEVASRHKSEFLASMSHELRTPLNAVLGFSEVLLERMFGDINERQEEYLRDIHGSGQHLLELLNEILDLSKVEAGRMDLEYAELDLEELLEASAAMLRDRAAGRGVELRVEVEPGVGAVYSDELRLKQVVLNLLTNAVKFTGADGSVRLQARRVGPELHVAVSDTGVGIPEEDRERIFESFQQGGRGATREEGTGLGLTLSRRIVELLGGRLWLDSEVGAGSTFTFSLPARLSGAGGAQPAGRAADVVVIEDDRASLDLITAYLSAAGVPVTAAHDGGSGLAAVRRERPAAVVLDIRLPDMDGWAVLRELKEDDATRAVPVVVVSMVDEPARGADLGAAAYLVKPVSRHDLLDALAGVGAVAGGVAS